MHVFDANQLQLLKLALYAVITHLLIIKIVPSALILRIKQFASFARTFSLMEFHANFATMLLIISAAIYALILYGKMNNVPRVLLSLIKKHVLFALILPS